MAQVHFTRNLNRFFPELAPTQISGATAADIVRAVDEKFPGLAGYIIDERGALRRHVNIFVDGSNILDREHLSDPVGPQAVVHIIQALSGG